MRADARPRFPDGLAVGDVVMMLRPGFWTRSGAFAAVRHCAVVALMALAGLGIYTMCALRLRDWRPSGREIVNARRRGKTVAIPVSPELRFVVERWLKERAKVVPPSDDPLEQPLFVTKHGTRVHPVLLNLILGRMGRSIGLKRRLAELLAIFAARSVEPDRFQDAVDVFLCRGRHDHVAASVPAARLRAMLKRRNPVRGLTRLFYINELPEGFRKRYGAAVPDAAGTLRQKRTPWPTPELPKDDPHVAALLAASWPKDEREWPAFRQRLIAAHIEAVIALTKDRKLRAKQTQALFRVRTDLEWERCLKSGARPKVRERRKKRAEESRRARPPTVREQRERRAEERRLARLPLPEEAARIRRLEGFVWPAGETEIWRARRELAAEHFPTLSAMIASGRLAKGEAARLLRYHPVRLGIMHREQVEVGSTGAVRVLASVRKNQDWIDRIVAAAAARPQGETVTEACIRFCDANSDCPYDFNRCRMFVYAVDREGRRAASNAGA